jgi:hypothetical protein
MKQQTVLLVVLAVLAATLVAYLVMRRKEHYANIGAINNVGAFVDDQYELIGETPESRAPGMNFGDIIDKGNAAVSIKQAQKLNAASNAGKEAYTPMDRLQRVQGSQLMPRVSSTVTPYNIDVADPATFSFQVQPRVLLKSPLLQNSDFYRGDIPITYFPNVSLINRSRYGRDDQKMDGAFSPYQLALYNKYTGKGAASMPLKVVNGDLIADY